MRITADVRARHPVERVCRAIVQVQTVYLTEVVACQQVQVAIPIHIPQGNRGSIVLVTADVRAHNPVERVCFTIVFIQAGGLTIIACQQIQITVPVYIPQGNRGGIVPITADVRTRHPAEWVYRTVVMVQAVGLALIPCHHVQVAIPIHIPQGNRVGFVRIAADVRARHPAERVCRAIVFIQAVGLISISCQHVQIAIAVHIPQDN